MPAKFKFPTRALTVPTRAEEPQSESPALSSQAERRPGPGVTGIARPSAGSLSRDFGNLAPVGDPVPGRAASCPRPCRRPVARLRSRAVGTWAPAPRLQAPAREVGIAQDGVRSDGRARCTLGSKVLMGKVRHEADSCYSATQATPVHHRADLFTMSRSPSR